MLSNTISIWFINTKRSISRTFPFLLRAFYSYWAVWRLPLRFCWPEFPTIVAWVSAPSLTDMLSWVMMFHTTSCKELNWREFPQSVALKRCTQNIKTPSFIAQNACGRRWVYMHHRLFSASRFHAQFGSDVFALFLFSYLLTHACTTGTVYCDS